MRADRRNPIINKIRRLKGDSFSVKLRDGTTREVTLSDKANRWEVLLDTLEKLPWKTIEVSAADKLLGVVDNDQEDEDEDEEEDESITDEIARAVERLVKINQTSNVVTMQETRKMFADAMKAQGDVMASMVSAMQTLQETYTVALQVQRAHLTTAGPAGDDDDDKVMKMVQMAMALRAQPGSAPGITLVPPTPAKKA
jgi:hypothetical protein